MYKRICMCGVVRLICECGYMREGERERVQRSKFWFILTVLLPKILDNGPFPCSSFHPVSFRCASNCQKLDFWELK